MNVDVRIYYQSRTDQLLTRKQATEFLLTGELPERIILATATAEQIARYHEADAGTQMRYRCVGGSITVANGRMTHHDPVPSSNRFVAYSAWEPYDKQDCQVWFNYTDGEGRISVGGTSRDLGTSLGFLRAQGLALELLNAAETQRLVAAATGE
jgi:hypothetical protein